MEGFNAEAARQRIADAAKGRSDSRATSLTRAQIELSAELVRTLDNAQAAGDIAKRHFYGDDRHWHIAMFTDRKGATAFMLDVVAAIEASR